MILFFKVLEILLAGILCAIVHEGAHYLSAKLFGKTIHFEFNWGKIAGIKLIPRWTWRQPDGLKFWQLAIVCLSGFTIEILIGLLFALFNWYTMLSIGLIHLFTYQYYAGEASDFNFLYNN